MRTAVSTCLSMAFFRSHVDVFMYSFFSDLLIFPTIFRSQPFFRVLIEKHDAWWLRAGTAGLGLSIGNSVTVLQKKSLFFCRCNCYLSVRKNKMREAGENMTSETCLYITLKSTASPHARRYGPGTGRATGRSPPPGSAQDVRCCNPR